MANKDQWVVTHEQGWAVKGAGNSKATAVYPTQVEAMQRGREIAKNQKSELVVQNREGKIRQKSSYGNDPFPPKG